MLFDKIKEMGENLRMLERQDRLQYLVDKARQVEPLPESAKIESNRIHGCASKLWIIGGEREDGTMMYQADGDAFITKGILLEFGTFVSYLYLVFIDEIWE